MKKAQVAQAASLLAGALLAATLKVVVPTAVYVLF